MKSEAHPFGYRILSQPVLSLLVQTLSTLGYSQSTDALLLDKRP